jgi:hypothetical protein
MKSIYSAVGEVPSSKRACSYMRHRRRVHRRPFCSSKIQNALDDAFLSHLVAKVPCNDVERNVEHRKRNILHAHWPNYSRRDMVVISCRRVLLPPENRVPNGHVVGTSRYNTFASYGLRSFIFVSKCSQSQAQQSFTINVTSKMACRRKVLNMHSEVFTLAGELMMDPYYHFFETNALRTESERRYK